MFKDNKFIYPLSQEEKECINQLAFDVSMVYEWLEMMETTDKKRIEKLANSIYLKHKEIFNAEINIKDYSYMRLMEDLRASEEEEE